MQRKYHLKCYKCQRPHEEHESVTTCVECGGPIETYYDYEGIERRLNVHSLKNSPISAMKYVAFYPIDNFQNIVSLSEGGTPLVHAKNLGEELSLKHLYLKNEGMNPTGCFKDRGTMVEITKAKELGAKAVCLASTGNMAASVAAYTSAAGIPCYVLVPEGTPLGKLAQTLTFGARVIQLRTDYSTCARLAEEMAKKFGYYLAGDYTFRAEGQKSQGYEIIEQLLWNCPDYILCPIGVGTNFHAIYKGMKELYELNYIKKLPKLIGVQTPGCNPVVKSFQKGVCSYEVMNSPRTVASAMCVADPLDAPKILSDIYESGGCMVEVTDDEILAAQQEQARHEGVFAEPSGSMPYAAVKKLAAENFFKPEDVIVCIVTGNGLKDPKSPLKVLPTPATLEPNFEEIEHFIESKLYAIRESGIEDNEHDIFTEEPASEDYVGRVIQKEFGVEVEPAIVEEVKSSVHSFIEKGKMIKKSDLKYILESVMSQLSLKDRVLEIKDFKIQTSFHQPAEATIWVNAFGENMEVHAKGVGPVDAAISALKENLQVPVHLTDYQVEINSAGVDSAVEVVMTLKNGGEQHIVARATSPDVIVASLKAFEKGFNILYCKNKKLRELKSKLDA